MAPFSAAADVIPADAIIVSNSAELIAALVPANAGRLIHMVAGTYNITAPLVVPDSATLEGEGDMLFDGSGLPTGFAPGTRTTIAFTANVAGDILTLGDGTTVRRIAIDDLPGRSGNSIGVRSRAEGDQLSTAITEVELFNPNAHGVIPSGPSGCGIAVLTQNLNLGAPPAAHSGAQISAAISRSLIHSPSSGTGCGLFAFNFAPLASVSVRLSDNVIGGGIVGNGGASRPDAVHDSHTAIQSLHNVYRDDSPDPCVSRHIGWNVNGGSGVPVNIQVGEAARNSLQIHSLNDRIERFTTGILGAGARRFFASPTAGSVTDNSLELQLIGTTFSTSACGGASFAADFRLAGAAVSGSTLIPGDGNTLRAVMRNVTGSGARFNIYADVLGSSGPVAPAYQGTGNSLEFTGNLKSFVQTNENIDPLPGAQFFTSGK